MSLLFALVGCASNSNNDQSISTPSNEVAWFTEGKWRQGWEKSLGAPIDTSIFFSNYTNNPEKWEKAFNYLGSTDLEKLPPGQYEIDGKDLFAIVLEYISKNESEVQFEAHKKYADIQYVIGGREKMGVGSLESATIIDPYNDEKDIAFYNTNTYSYTTASADNFFLFFPNDVHRPGVSLDESKLVKKIVIKVKL